jgi:predicted RNase H-like HicB family nuclease
MEKKKKITMTVEKTDTGFSAYSEDNAIYTTGQSIPELINCAYEATEFYFEDEIVKIVPSDIKFEINFNQFF